VLDTRGWRAARCVELLRRALVPIDVERDFRSYEFASEQKCKVGAAWVTIDKIRLGEDRFGIQVTLKLTWPWSGAWPGRRAVEWQGFDRVLDDLGTVYSPRPAACGSVVGGMSSSVFAMRYRTEQYWAPSPPTEARVLRFVSKYPVRLIARRGRQPRESKVIEVPGDRGSTCVVDLDALRRGV
jgi:hypothetical protein